MPDRIHQEVPYCGTRYTIYTGDVPVKETYIKNSAIDSLIWSTGHYGYPDFPPDRDVGGAFKLRYQRIENGTFDVGTIQGGSAYAEYRYNGSVHTACTQASLPALNWSDPSALGATAYKKMKPDKPSMSGLNSIVELKDLPGMLKQRFHAKGLHEIGDYYLAQQFGWNALARDVVSMVVTQRQAQQRLKQLLRDEGRPVKRMINLSDSSTMVSDTTGTGNYLQPSFVIYFYKDAGSWHNTSILYRRQWAKARFRYWLPGGPRDIEWTNSMLRRIFGFRATPEVVYNAIPWSWLVDWFTNCGDMISNLETSLVDRLAADYFYLMDNTEQVFTTTCKCTFARVGSQASVPATATGTATTGWKTRLGGDPFGWGTSENSLSGVQKGILGALGLSRLR